MQGTVIDVSHHNGHGAAFDRIAEAGIHGVIHKATQGCVVVDPLYEKHRSVIASHNLLFGAYHFGDGSDGAAQARHFLSAACPKPGELVCLDFESNPAGASMTLDQARLFVTEVFGAIRKWPLLYSGDDLKRMLGGRADPVLRQCPLWLAQYGPTAVVPPGWSTWSLWQYTDGMTGLTEPVDGIGFCDRSRFNGDPAALAAFWKTVSP